jgi:hypothetical protein
MSQSRVVFLFGAGASKGAGFTLPECPPVMIELYDRLVAYDSSSWGPGSRIAQYAAKFRQDFEDAYSKFMVGVSPDATSPRIIVDSLTILERQRPLALYFSRFSLDRSGSDLYSKVLSRLMDCNAVHKCFFGSLNYDTLFEQSASRLGLLVDYSCDVIGLTHIRVAKLHGSCNFVAEVSEQTRAYYLSGPGAMTEGPINFLEASADLETQLRGKFKCSNPTFLPIMSQITPEKQTYYNSMKIQAIRHKWLSAVGEAEVVVVVGVSYNPNDLHIVEPIKQCHGRVLYIGGEFDFEKWSQHNDKFEFLETTFSAGFEKLVEVVCAACT